jgi:ComF family protein
MLGIANRVLNVLFPLTCAGCGISTDQSGMRICWDCRASLSIITAPMCDVCGEPVHGQVDHAYVCHGCTKRPPDFRHARAAIQYNVLGKRLITQFKYGNALWLEPYLVDLLYSCVTTHFDTAQIDALCAVPLHPVKRRERGYNQSVLLVSALARKLNLPVIGRKSLRRSRMTPSQTRLTAGQRITNVRGAFEVKNQKEWLGKQVLLVDDVMTTGATVSACAGAILNAGAQVVDVVTVARGI